MAEPLEFNVVYDDAGDGWVYAHVPELPEVHTQGESLDAARDAVRDAIRLVLDERRAHGCRLAREAAKHELWENPSTGQRTTVPRHREIKMPTARGICRQLGIPPAAGR